MSGKTLPKSVDSGETILSAQDAPNRRFQHANAHCRFAFPPRHDATFAKVIHRTPYRSVA